MACSLSLSLYGGGGVYVVFVRPTQKQFITEQSLTALTYYTLHICVCVGNPSLMRAPSSTCRVAFFIA